jgi:hypothetical protein
MAARGGTVSLTEHYMRMDVRLALANTNVPDQ